MTLHAHAAIWIERQFKTETGEPIKHFREIKRLLIVMKSESEVVQLCLTLCDPVDCSQPGSSVHGILQARILEWVAISYCPKKVAVMHCKGHNSDEGKVAEGYQPADCQVRKAAVYKTPALQTPLIWTGSVEQEKPQYTEEELEGYEKREAKITDKGWLQSEDG